MVALLPSALLLLLLQWICVGSSVDCPSSPSAAAHALPTAAATAIGADKDSEYGVDRSRQPARLTVSTVASR